jgi:hypothetical protein
MESSRGVSRTASAEPPCGDTDLAPNSDMSVATRTLSMVITRLLRETTCEPLILSPFLCSRSRPVSVSQRIESVLFSASIALSSCDKTRRRPHSSQSLPGAVIHSRWEVQPSSLSDSDCMPRPLPASRAPSRTISRPLASTQREGTSSSGIIAATRPDERPASSALLLPALCLAQRMETALPDLTFML